MAAVSAPLRKGVLYFMVESITYLIAFAIVLVAFDKIINDIKKKGSMSIVGVNPKKKN